MRKPHVLAALATSVVIAGCGAGHSGSGDHSVADVKSAMRAVGLNGFKTISKASLSPGKQMPGVNPDQIAGALIYNHFTFGPIQNPPAGQTTTDVGMGSGVVVVVTVAKSASLVDRIEREARKEQTHEPRLMNVRQAHAGNVLILSVFEHPDARARDTLARLPKLVSYLDAH